MTLRSLLREPLVHFFALGAALFLLFGSIHRGAVDAPDEIVVDRGRVEALRAQHERLWQRQPTEAELRGLVDDWVREEILYREGLALGLDRDDPVLRRRIAQKMTFLADAADAPVPTEEELEAWLAAHADDYRIEPTYSFRQVYFDPQRHGTKLAETVERARDALAGGADPGTAGDPTLLPGSMARATASDVRLTFGVPLADALAPVATGSWVGPLPSAYGVHLVRIDARTPPRAATLDDVRAAVERDLDAARRKAADDALYEGLRKRYRVRIDDDAELAAR